MLTHVTNQIQAIEHGAPVDLVFQSIAGTEAANRSFGIDLALLHEARDAALSLKRGPLGDNVMYFETGQGSALSANAHHGMDQQTCEARAYGVARTFDPLTCNTVVGFIGPEYLFDGKQILRAGLEDHFCGKLLGLPIGCDVCYTNHAEADSDDMDTLMTLLGVAGVTFLIGVPGADDVMLNDQSTSFHDALYLREVLGLKRAPEFEAWLQRMGLSDAVGRLLPVTAGHALLGPVIVATQARVALGDDIGQRLAAPMVAVLIGERPGLTSPDSLGVYLTHAPRVGRTDAQRNCLSNVRAEGLQHADAARKLWWLAVAAQQSQLTGVGLKDRSDLLARTPP